MKVKNLRKKIRRLEIRLQKGTKKLLKLKRKLDAATVAGAAQTEGESGGRRRKARKIVMAFTPARTTRHLAPQSRVQPAAAVRARSGPKKVKRKLNLAPERRAQLAAAMRARWAAKRGAAANSQATSADQGFTVGDASQSQ